MAEEVIALFVEGDTEVEFYKLLISALFKMNGGKLAFKHEIINMKGIGSYKDRAKRILKNKLQVKYRNYKIHVFLCYDTDVFTLSKQPPINWTEVRKALIETGATVNYIKAQKSIEDWFLLDIEGVLRYLRLPDSTKCTGSGGMDQIEKLFKKAGKVYIKGSASKAFINSLCIEKIMLKICSELRPLCLRVGLKCKSQEICNNAIQMMRRK